ncbi:hypothetical protein M5W82_19695 [Lysinibacillus xylanilyticus]|uniref:Uncharacterized protein n=1 Tax=Lysinibacillus xylanilyticus TaxID=582475 RepID=A0ABT4ETV0_9BACI|nr:hypothetical protein [Lysinibacillus xylanilyticus]MCY9549105.1 hypothetical protein [Lysinibacillus xylanilyticus]
MEPLKVTRTLKVIEVILIRHLKFAKRNSIAEKHGFFSKFLPEETLEIMEAMNERSPADLIWDQI